MRIGRNDPCPCGSGLKFKKCCLLRDYASKYSPELIKEARERLRDDKLLLYESPSDEKMSQVLLDFIDPVLAVFPEVIHNKPRTEALISLACIAWNMALVPKEDRGKLGEGAAAMELFAEPVFADIKRFIVNYELKWQGGEM